MLTLVRRGSRVALCPALWIWLAATGAGCGSVHKDDGDGSVDEEGGGDAGGDGAGDGADDGDGGDGGDSGPQELCTGASGERVRQIVRQHDDGTSEVVGLHDVALGFDCRFARDHEGTTRCLPIGIGPFGTQAFRVFTDAACTDLLATFDAAGPTPQVAAFGEQRDCETMYRYHELGAELTFPEESIGYTRNPGTGACTPTTIGGTQQRYFRVAAEIGPERFLAATETVTGDGRLGVRVIEGEDGSRVCDRSGVLVDSELGARPCAAAHGSDGALRCLPTSNRLVEVSTSSTCAASVTATREEVGCALDRQYSREEVAPSCTARWQMRERGARIEGTIYLDHDIACPLATSGDAYFEIGPVAPPSSFPELTEEVVNTGNRLHRIDHVGDGVRIDRPTWYDSELDVLCAFIPWPVQSSRCLPGAIGIPQASVTSFYYTDADCVGPRAEVAVFADPCGLGGEPKYARGEGPIYGIRDRLVEPRYQLDDIFCVPAPETLTFYSLGAEVPVETFAAGTAAIE